MNFSHNVSPDTPHALPTTLPEASRNPPGNAPNLRLLHAAQQFEAIMLAELMKPLSTSSAIGSEDREDDKPNNLQGFAVESMAGALARAGALGFAKRITASVERLAKTR